jgi:hypothetical protein
MNLDIFINKIKEDATEKDKALVNPNLIGFEMKNCDRVEDFAATEERRLEKWRLTRKTSTKMIFVLHVDDGHRGRHTITIFFSDNTSFAK